MRGKSSRNFSGGFFSQSLTLAARLGAWRCDGGIFKIIGGPQAHQQSVEKQRLEGSEKRGDTLIVPVQGRG
jgi:hypothetical protein